MDVQEIADRLELGELLARYVRAVNGDEARVSASFADTLAPSRATLAQPSPGSSAAAAGVTTG